MDSVSSQYKYAQEVKAALEKDASSTRLVYRARGLLYRRLLPTSSVVCVSMPSSLLKQQAEQQKIIRMQQEGEYPVLSSLSSSG